MRASPEYAPEVSGDGSAANAHRAATKRMREGLSPGRHTASLESRRPDLGRRSVTDPRIQPAQVHTNHLMKGAQVMRTLWRTLPSLGAAAAVACVGASA